MANQEILIKYDIQEIFECRQDNCLLPRELEQYCSGLFKNNKSVLNDLIKSMDDITKSHSQGVNPNDISLRNIMRDNLNKINVNNHKEILENLKSLNYTCENHFALLASELIIKSMNDVMAWKGLESNKNQLTPSEIYMHIALEFSSFFIKQGNDIIKFRRVLTHVCQKYFKEFTDKTYSMDQNNKHRVNNYKGFINMLGLLYCNNVFPNDIIIKCFDRIIKLILGSELSQEECDNYYSGYERLMNKVLSKFEVKEITESLNNEFKNIRDYISEINKKILLACDSKDDHKTKPIRMYSIMIHNQYILRFEGICKLYDEYKKKQ